jgi:glyoxylase-like metal-dependent hydrolase (beta-lactamase superfamily II)
VEQLAADLWSLPVPIPHNPLRYVSVYAFALTGGGIGLIDAGWDSEPGWHALTTGLAALGGSVADVRGVLVTHLHFDHLGMAGRIREASGAWIAMHEADVVDVQRLTGKAAAAAAADEVDFLVRLGAEPDEARADAADAGAMEPFLRMATADRLLEDGELAEFPGWQLRALHTPGHTAGHLCFLEERTDRLFSGDHVLPRISPNISTTADGAADPLRSYLSSLAAVRDLDPTEVLPAHEWRFTGLAHRVDELRAHHEHRLDELLRALRTHPDSTPWELAAQLTWSRPWSSYRRRMRIFAVTETDAHLRLLHSRGLAEATGGPVPTWSALFR